MWVVAEKNDVVFVRYYNRIIPVVKTRKNRTLARKISYMVFVEGVSDREAIVAKLGDLPPKKQRFVSRYLRALWSRGLIEFDDGKIVPTVKAHRKINYYTRLFETQVKKQFYGKLLRLRERYSITQLSHLLGVPQGTLKSWIYEGVLPRNPEVIRRVMEVRV